VNRELWEQLQQKIAAREFAEVDVDAIDEGIQSQ